MELRRTRKRTQQFDEKENDRKRERQDSSKVRIQASVNRSSLEMESSPSFLEGTVEMNKSFELQRAPLTINFFNFRTCIGLPADWCMVSENIYHLSFAESVNNL